MDRDERLLVYERGRPCIFSSVQRFTPAGLAVLRSGKINSLLVGVCIMRHTNHTCTHTSVDTLLKCSHTPTLLHHSSPHTHTHTHQTHHHHTFTEKRSNKPETIAGLSAAAQNKRRATRWSSLLLGVSLRVGARGSAGGESRGFSDDGTTINIYTVSALPCFVLSLVCAGEPYIIRAPTAISLMHELAGAVLCAPHTRLYGLVLLVAYMRSD